MSDVVAAAVIAALASVVGSVLVFMVVRERLPARVRIAGSQTRDCGVQTNGLFAHPAWRCLTSGRARLVEWSWQAPGPTPLRGEDPARRAPLNAGATEVAFRLATTCASPSWHTRWMNVWLPVGEPIRVGLLGPPRQILGGIMLRFVEIPHGQP